MFDWASGWFKFTIGPGVCQFWYFLFFCTFLLVEKKFIFVWWPLYRSLATVIIIMNDVLNHTLSVIKRIHCKFVQQIIISNNATS